MMYFRKMDEPAGEYVSADGLRYSVSMARRIRSAVGINVGYEPFSSLQEALAAWGLVNDEHEGGEV